MEKNAKMTERISLSDFHEKDEGLIAEITEPEYLHKFNDFHKKAVQIISFNSTVVGWVHIHVPDSSLYDGYIFIYVSPSHRRRGIGTWVYRHVVSKMIPVGCNWWTSYPESTIADQFALSVGFDYTNTNSYMVYNGTFCDIPADGIRPCRAEDYPTALDIWSHEYAEMHKRIGLPFEKHELTEAERKQKYDQFVQDLPYSYVVEVDRQMIGYGMLFRDNSGIGSLAVDRAFAGHGYGTKIAAFLTNECIRRGNKTPCLYCESGNDIAMHVYQKIGYTEVSRETVALKNWKDQMKK